MTTPNYITYTVPPLLSVVLITAIVLIICWRWRSKSRQEEDDSKRDSNPLYGLYYMGEERLGEAWVVDSSDTYGQVEVEGQEGTRVQDNNPLYE